MKGAHLPDLLAQTLAPATIDSASQELQRIRSQPNFAVQMLVISDDIKHNIAIRQSALICLKNLLQDHCVQGGLVPTDDINVLKDSLLEGNSLPTQPSFETFSTSSWLLPSKRSSSNWPRSTTRGSGHR